MNTRTIIGLILCAAFSGARSDGTCYDPGGYCGECPCEDACYGHLDCPPGSYCRWNRSGPSSCGCVYSGDGAYDWLVSADVAPRCEMAGVSPGRQWFTFRIIGAPEGRTSIGWAINNHGQVVGYWQNLGVFTWEKGVFTELAGPARNVRADINDHDQVVLSLDGEGDERGTFLISAPGKAPVRLSDSYSSSASINNAGQVLFYDDGEAMLWRDGVAVPVIALSDPPLRSPFLLNNLGHLAGTLTQGGTWRLGLLMDDKLIGLGNPTGIPEFVAALNDLPQVVFDRGYNPEDDPKWGVYLWDNGAITELNDAFRCHPVYSVQAINNCGEMILILDDVRDAPECKGVFPFRSAGLYSPQTGYHPITALFEDTYRWEDVFLTDINDRGQILGNAKVLYNAETQPFLWDRGFVVSPYPGDLTRDGPIDLNDYAHFFERFGLPTTDYSILCNRADFDEDADTDLSDFATFQNLFTGPP